MPSDFKKAAILGTGLIGASIGLALKQRKLAEQVIGLARRETTLQTAVKIGAIDSGVTRLKEAIRGADLVIFAAPIQASIELIKQTGKLAGSLGEKPLLTDACSTKVAIVKAAEEFLPKELDFIPGHPMAGAETAGPQYARGDLFEGATWVITPTQASSPEALDRAEGLIRALGANSLCLSPESHDRMAAAVSHMPHLLSVALIEQAAEVARRQPEVWQVAASGFRDMTRLASGNAEVWRDICLTNSQRIADAIANYRHGLENIEKLLREQKGPDLQQLLSDAQQLRKKLKD